MKFSFRRAVYHLSRTDIRQITYSEEVKLSGTSKFIINILETCCHEKLIKYLVIDFLFRSALNYRRRVRYKTRRRYQRETYGFEALPK